MNTNGIAKRILHMAITSLSFQGGTFKIMQIADVQENPTVSKDTIRLLTLALQKEKPDLAVFTGDQIYGLNPFFRLCNTQNKVQNTIRQIIRPLEELCIPFAVTFGNHDCQCGLSHLTQLSYYQSSPYFVQGIYKNENDRATLYIPVNDQNGECVFQVVLFDSQKQEPSGEYLPVPKERLRWYQKLIDENTGRYGKNIPQLVFQHIPVPEFYHVLKQAPKTAKGAVEAFRTHKNQYYVLPDEMLEKGDFMLESPATPDKNSGEFDLLKKNASAVCIAVGHDHNNSFVGEYEGIKLIYTQCAGFHVYGPHLNRGVRLFEINRENPWNFSTKTLTYRELTNKPLSEPLLEFALTHIPTSMEQVKRIAAFTLTGTALLAVVGTVGGFFYIKRRNE